MQTMKSTWKKPLTRQSLQYGRKNRRLKIINIILSYWKLIECIVFFWYLNCANYFYYNASIRWELYRMFYALSLIPLKRKKKKKKSYFFCFLPLPPSLKFFFPLHPIFDLFLIGQALSLQILIGSRSIDMQGLYYKQRCTHACRLAHAG